MHYATRLWVSTNHNKLVAIVTLLGLGVQPNILLSEKLFNTTLVNPSNKHKMGSKDTEIVTEDLAVGH